MTSMSLPQQLESLSDEILLMIFEQVFLVSGTSLHSLCTVSRRFLRLAGPILYRSVSVDNSVNYNTVTTKLDNERYTRMAMILAHSRHMTVRKKASWLVLTSLLLRMEHLETLSWAYWDKNHTIPPYLRYILESRWPRAGVHIEGFKLPSEHSSAFDPTTFNNLTKLLNPFIGLPNLTILKIEYASMHSTPMKYLERFLLRNKQLEVFHLTVPRDENGILQWVEPSRQDMQPAEKPTGKISSLQELVYESVAEPEQQMFPVSFFDTTKLRHLELRGAISRSFIKQMATQEPKLRTLILEELTAEWWDGGISELEDFLQRNCGLETFHIRQPMKKVSVLTICVHNATLKSLSIRNDRLGHDPYYPIPRAHPYTSGELEVLCSSCINLSSLTLDIVMADEMPLAALTTISSYPCLTNLTLYICYVPALNWNKTRYNLYEPHFATDQSVAQEFFTYLRAHKIGREFQSIELMIGDFQRQWQKTRRGRPSQNFRPDILFTYRVGEEGEVVMEDDVKDEDCEMWKEYFREISNGSSSKMVE